MADVGRKANVKHRGNTAKYIGKEGWKGGGEEGRKSKRRQDQQIPRWAISVCARSGQKVDWITDQDQHFSGVVQESSEDCRRLNLIIFQYR